ncbi:MAG: 30S ribosomal protein S12 methylthiotransferase RimO [Anaerolineaceae bacterium]|nr:30S ribosomal protein S12 methylthiotransferase RimO [Anaerolineaceae bacterium]
MKPNTFHLVSLGCAKNTVDSTTMGNLLTRAGYSFENDPAKAEVLIVNTCGFIRPAREEAIETINELGKTKSKKQILIAAGCMAEKFSDELKLHCRKIDAFVGTRKINQISQVIENLRSGTSLQAITPRFDMDRLSQYALQGSSAYLKIADGCSRRCAFCAIPNIKGEWHSRPAEEILRDAAELDEQGIKELILIAQDTTSYGIDRGEKDALPKLLEQIEKAAPNIPWIRILYAFPGYVSDHLIDLMAEENHILPYLDIPLQHAHPATLKRMLRPSDMDSVRRTLEYMRKRMPHIAIRSTFITGFPGETEEEFTALYQFIEAMEFDRVGVFPYYSEKDTPSAKYADDVPEEVKLERQEHLYLLQQEISHEVNLRFVGKTLDVLIEGVQEDGMLVGRSYRDAPEIDGLVFVKGKAPIGEIVPVQITGTIGDYDLLGNVKKK